MTRLTASPLIEIGKLIKLEYFCTICCISVFYANFLSDSLRCRIILVPLSKESSSIYVIWKVPVPSLDHLFATCPSYLDITYTKSATIKEE